MLKIINSLFLQDLLVVGFLCEDQVWYKSNWYKKGNNKILLKTRCSI